MRCGDYHCSQEPWSPAHDGVANHLPSAPPLRRPVLPASGVHCARGIGCSATLTGHHSCLDHQRPACYIFPQGQRTRWPAGRRRLGFRLQVPPLGRSRPSGCPWGAAVRLGKRRSGKRRCHLRIMKPAISSSLSSLFRLTRSQPLFGAAFFCPSPSRATCGLAYTLVTSAPWPGRVGVGPVSVGMGLLVLILMPSGV